MERENGMRNITAPNTDGHTFYFAMPSLADT